MSIDIDWSVFEEFDEIFRLQVNEFISHLDLPEFLTQVTLDKFTFGTVKPILEILEITPPNVYSSSISGTTKTSYPSKRKFWDLFTTSSEPNYNNSMNFNFFRSQESDSRSLINAKLRYQQQQQQQDLKSDRSRVSFISSASKIFTPQSQKTSFGGFSALVFGLESINQRLPEKSQIPLKDPLEMDEVESVRRVFPPGHLTSDFETGLNRVYKSHLEEHEILTEADLFDSLSNSADDKSPFLSPSTPKHHHRQQQQSNYYHPHNTFTSSSSKSAGLNLPDILVGGLRLRLYIKYDGNASFDASCTVLVNSPFSKFLSLPIEVSINHLLIDGIITVEINRHGDCLKIFFEKESEIPIKDMNVTVIFGSGDEDSILKEKKDKIESFLLTVIKKFLKARFLLPNSFRINLPS